LNQILEERRFPWHNALTKEVEYLEGDEATLVAVPVAAPVAVPVAALVAMHVAKLVVVPMVQWSFR
jgi:hypothetical protein